MDSIALVNARALYRVKRARTGEPVPPEIDEAWSTYIMVLKNKWGKMPRKDPKRYLRKAYRRFFDTHKKYQDAYDDRKKQ